MAPKREITQLWQHSSSQVAISTKIDIATHYRAYKLITPDLKSDLEILNLADGFKQVRLSINQTFIRIGVTVCAWASIELGIGEILSGYNTQ